MNFTSDTIYVPWRFWDLNYHLFESRNLNQIMCHSYSDMNSRILCIEISKYAKVRLFMNSRHLVSFLMRFLNIGYVHEAEICEWNNLNYGIKTFERFHLCSTRMFINVTPLMSIIKLTIITLSSNYISNYI